MSEIIDDNEFIERPPNAYYRCKVSQRLDGQAPYATIGRREEELYSIQEIHGFAYLSAEQPMRRTSPMFAEPHDSEIPVIYDFVISGYSPQDEDGVMRINSRNLVWLGDK